MVLTPPEDIWVEVLDRPEIVNQVTQVVVVENVIWTNPPAANPTPAGGVPVFGPAGGGNRPQPVFGPSNSGASPFVVGPAPAAGDGTQPAAPSVIGVNAGNTPQAVFGPRTN